MNQTQLETRAELLGYFKAFEEINMKLNHTYSFRLSFAPPTSDISAAVASHLPEGAAEFNFASVTNWRDELSRTLIRWLFLYLIDDPTSGCLTDEDKRFALSYDDYRQTFTDRLVTQIDSLSPVQSAYRIEFTDFGPEFHELVLVAIEHLVFVDFECTL